MHRSHNLHFKTSKYLLVVMALTLIAVICMAFSMEESNDFDISRREVVLRRIGHELLLQSGDKTSRVLPVKKTAENEYQINFEKEFAFQPDSLVNITTRLLAKAPLATDYVVNVLNCSDFSVAYGFAISKNKKDDIVTCKGRVQPKACYIISIKFKPAGVNTAKAGYVLGGISLFVLAGFIVVRTAKPRKALPNGQPNDVFTLGLVVFDAKNRLLIINETTTELTGTETRVLRIFAASPNETIARSRLQKEIWEDEGVIVGRSLDMFISKLRKKLESDHAVNIVAIRGKGYKLEVSI